MIRPGEKEPHTFRYYQDAGHGWIAVKKGLINDLCLEPTTCSFVKGSTIYLEEDYDAARFVKAYKAKFNVEPILKVTYSHRRSAVRNYQNFTPDVMM